MIDELLKTVASEFEASEYVAPDWRVCDAVYIVSAFAREYDRVPCAMHFFTTLEKAEAFARHEYNAIESDYPHCYHASTGNAEAVWIDICYMDCADSYNPCR